MEAWSVTSDHVNFVYSSMASRSQNATNSDLDLLELKLQNEVNRLSAKSRTTNVRKNQTSDMHIRYDAKTGKQGNPRCRIKKRTAQVVQSNVGK